MAGAGRETTNMKRRTLDLIFAVGGLLVALLILVLGLVLQNQANFAKNYVHNQLGRAEDHLHAGQVPGGRRERSLLEEVRRASRWSPASRPSATPTTTSACTSRSSTTARPTPRRATTPEPWTRSSRRCPTRTAPAAKQLSAQAQALHGKATTLFQGETLRGLLLTSYGFSIFGERAQQAADVCFALALVLFLAAIAGFVHAATKKADHVILSEG